MRVFHKRQCYPIEVVSSSPLNFHLEQYDGPLDLLLDLIRKQQIDIYDIPISDITAQYLKYMESALQLDFELSSEFVYMAATLIHIKSKTLLPRDPELQKMDPEEDPRKELVDQLIEHERFKNAAEMLQQKRLVEEVIWSNPQLKNFMSEDDDPGLDVTLFDLVQTLQKILERTKLRPAFEITKEDVSVPDMIHFLRNVLGNSRKSEPVSATDLFERQRSRRAMICLFLAILELVKLQAVSLAQKDEFGDIVLKRGDKFDEVSEDEQAISQLEGDYI